ncbi:hypothetical protein [Intrasporangium oryzae]|nr:hypothetical protein [Intrasporangium oryzae]
MTSEPSRRPAATTARQPSTRQRAGHPDHTGYTGYTGHEQRRSS